MTWIDLTKGLAILGIVFFHFFQNYPDRLDWVVVLDRLGAKIGYGAVDIFFVIAGFNISYSLALKAYKNNSNKITTHWRSWLFKRLNRLYPTYFLAIGMTLLLYAILNQSRKYYSFKFLLTLFGFAGSSAAFINSGLWFFTVILQAYLITPIIFWICKSQARKIFILGMVVGIVSKLICLTVPFESRLYWNLLQHNHIGSYFFQFCLGLYWGIVFSKHQSLRKIDKMATVGLFIVSVIFYGLLIFTKTRVIYMQGFDIAFTPFLFLVCYLGFEYLAKFEKQLKYILKSFSISGLYSYQIYLIHQPLFFVLLPYIVKNLTIDPNIRVAIAIGISGVLLILYVILFIFVERLLRKIASFSPIKLNF
ncbi:MAG: acyltransferase [Cyanobacteria bacterium SBLK]|nr:acyltransferase [Cyanobacteria bacterium SBLK]